MSEDELVGDEIIDMSDEVDFDGEDLGEDDDLLEGDDFPRSSDTE